MARKRFTIIESLGAYLPERVVTTEEVIRGCTHTLVFPLEQFTGIASRRVVGDGEYAIDLAQKAVEDCFANSRYDPGDIDLLICCNIVRYDGPYQIFYEPSTSVRLRERLRFDNALVFDISNACAGMFTAIYLSDCFIKAGAIRRAMVVSGEYISHVSDTARKEINGFMDPRLACLTLGDSGIAMILEQGQNDTFGFHDIQMYTLGRYSRYCIGKATDRPTGGAIMLTDVIKLSATAVRQASEHAAYVQQQQDWAIDLMNHLIMHQTSQKTISDGIRAVNKLYKRPVAHEGNVIRNLRDRGNTATTSHFVAVHDHIQTNAIRPGDHTLFSINASGLTIGTALYTFDALPSLLRDHANHVQPRNDAPLPRASHPPVRIESIGTLPAWLPAPRDTFALSNLAVEQCLEQSAYDRSMIDLLIYAGMYRNEFIAEPAIGAMVAGDAKINAVIESQESPKTLAFDLFNGAVGFLQACYVATQMIHGGAFNHAMVVASEIENNAVTGMQPLLGLKETGSAVILDRSPDGITGFGAFAFRFYTEHIDAFTSYANLAPPAPSLVWSKDPALEERYLWCVADAVAAFLDEQGLERGDIALVIPPQISKRFTQRLSQCLDMPPALFVDVCDDGGEYGTSSLPYALRHAREHMLVDTHDLALIICVGAGIQVGCALYSC